MVIDPAIFSHDSEEWATPKDLFMALDDMFHFTLDPCATVENAKCKIFYTKEDDGLSKSWEGHVVFCNPPYGKDIGKWLEKAILNPRPKTVVYLLPARTDTKWFHKYVMSQASYVYLIQGRVKFERPSGSATVAPFPSMILVYDFSKTEGFPKLRAFTVSKK